MSDTLQYGDDEVLLRVKGQDISFKTMEEFDDFIITLIDSRMDIPKNEGEDLDIDFLVYGIFTLVAVYNSITESQTKLHVIYSFSESTH